MRSPRFTRIAASSAAALVLAAALAGCGSDSDSKDKGESKDSAPKVSALTTAEATTALMTVGNLGGQFEENPNADHTTKSPGCLAALDPFTDDTEAPTDAVRDFATSSNESVAITSQVQSFDSVEDAEDAVETFRTAMKDCTAIDETDAGGVSYKLTVDTDDEKTDDDVDEQINVIGYGSGADASGEVPFGFQLAAVRVGNSVSIVTLAAQTEEPPGDFTELIQVVADRLEAVAEGDEPDESVVAGK